MLTARALEATAERFEWFRQLKLLFPQPEEYEQARAIYDFDSANDDGLTPQQAYDDFDEWTRE